MTANSSAVSQGLVVLLAAIPFIAVVAWLVVRHRRRRRQNAFLMDDEDHELIFPETEADRPVRRTTIGRKIRKP